MGLPRMEELDAPESSGTLPGCGTVYRLSRKGSRWVLYDALPVPGEMRTGHTPTRGVTVGPDGGLYGTT